MKHVRPVLLCAILLSTFALPRVGQSATEFGIAGFGGLQTYSMSDMNTELIAPINVLLSGTGFKMDEINNGLGFGGGVRIRPEGNLLIAFDYTRLTGSTDLTDPGVETLEIKTPANGFTGTLIYLFPSASRARFGLGGGIGLYSSAGEIKDTDLSSGASASVKLEGNGFGFHAMGVADVLVASNFHMEAGIGYRYAKSKDVTVAGSVLGTSTGEKFKLDWGGLMSRVGFAVYFGGK